MSNIAIECLVPEPEFLPRRANPTDAGADLMSTETCALYPGEQKMIDTGVAVKIPAGFAGFVFNRSSQGKAGISIPHSVGIIDSDYRGNIKVILKNNGSDVYKISRGNRIAQLLIMPVVMAEFIESTQDSEAWNDTQRGIGGFGSTGL